MGREVRGGREPPTCATSMLRVRGCDKARVRVLGRHLNVWTYPLVMVERQTQKFTVEPPESGSDEEL